MKKQMLKMLMIVIVWMLVVAGGCVTQPFIRPRIKDTQTFNASYDKVWTATVQTVIESGRQVSAIEKESGLISWTPEIFTFDDSVVVVPQIFCAIWSNLRISGSAYVTMAQNSNQTTVKMITNIGAFNRNEYGGGGKWYAAYSKGLIEKRYLIAIQEKLQR